MDKKWFEEEMKTIREIINPSQEWLEANPWKPGLAGENKTIEEEEKAPVICIFTRKRIG